MTVFSATQGRLQPVRACTNYYYVLLVYRSSTFDTTFDTIYNSTGTFDSTEDRRQSTKLRLPETRRRIYAIRRRAGRTPALSAGVSAAILLIDGGQEGFWDALDLVRTKQQRGKDASRQGRLADTGGRRGRRGDRLLLHYATRHAGDTDAAAGLQDPLGGYPSDHEGQGCGWTVRWLLAVPHSVFCQVFHSVLRLRNDCKRR